MDWHGSHISVSQQVSTHENGAPWIDMAHISQCLNKVMTHENGAPWIDMAHISQCLNKVSTHENGAPWIDMAHISQCLNKVCCMRDILCRLRSIATHRDHFVRRLSIRPSVCLSVRLSHFPKLCFAGDTCIPWNAATIFKVSYTWVSFRDGNTAFVAPAEQSATKGSLRPSSVCPSVMLCFCWRHMHSAEYWFATGLKDPSGNQIICLLFLNCVPLTCKKQYFNFG